ncbi:MAG TPA: ABC transporter permease, partial [Planctomycetaceae bacterium]|nr:ABC transporter permease [Planctomycetaceae bacterium]
GIVVISFIVIHLAPGDPAAQKFGGVGQAASGVNAERGTEMAEKRFRERYHLDKPLYIQFGYFVQRLARLDLQYYQRPESILPDFKRHLAVTLAINAIVFVLIYLLAIPIGVYSASFPNSWGDRITTVGLFMLYSLPSFWVATMLIIYLAGWAKWFPIGNLHSSNAENMTTFRWCLDWVWHVTLPIACLTYGGLAYLSRQMRAGMLETIRQDYIRTARAKGLPESRVVLVHALRNSLFPIITLFSSLLPFLIGGSVIVESIFNIHGMGWWAFEAIDRREYDVVMATLILSAVMTLVGILISDILYVFVNPQVTFESRS